MTDWHFYLVSAEISLKNFNAAPVEYKSLPNSLLSSSTLHEKHFLSLNVRGSH